MQLHLQTERRQCFREGGKAKNKQRGNVVPLASRTSECTRHRLNSAPNVVPAHTQARRAEFCQRCCRNMQGRSGMLCGTTCIPVEVTRVRVTAKEFNDAKKYGPLAELCLLLLQNMRRETGTIEPGQTCVSPLEMTL